MISRTPSDSISECDDGYVSDLPICPTSPATNVSILPNTKGESWLRSHPLTAVPSFAWTLLCIMIRSGPLWIINLWRLIIFIILLLPGLWTCTIFYFFNSQVVKNVRYGPNPRNLLDLYLPTWVRDPSKKLPVVVVVGGGTWLIGYKAWSCLLCRCLVRFGFVCVVADFRNFPQGTVSDMVNDLHYCLRWAFDNVVLFGGDPSSVLLLGYSSGAQLAMMATIEQAKLASGVVEGNEPVNWFQETPKWPVQDLLGVMGISGPYNIVQHVERFHKHGLSRKLLLRVMGGKFGMKYYSPTLRVESSIFSQIKTFLPPIYLFHGLEDKTVTPLSTIQLAEALTKHQCQVYTRFYEKMTHSGPFLEDLLNSRDGDDDIVADIGFVVLNKQVPPYGRHKKSVSVFHHKSRLIPPLCLSLARKVNPF